MTPNEPERLQRFLARSGVASRRGAEDLIAAGRVRVNGVVVSEMGVKVTEGADAVTVDGREVSPVADHAYFALNKPAGYVTTLHDPEGRHTIAELMPDVGRRLFAVGRLDQDTTGLLILTDDGDLAHRLMHPRYHVEKSYVAVVRGAMGSASADALERGVTLDDGKTAPAQVAVLERGERTSTVRLTIREGRKRQVRRMLASVGHRVITLTRDRIGAVLLGDLAEGSTRPLSDDEIAWLRGEGAEG